MQTKWDETYLTQMQNEKDLTQMRRLTQVRCLTSYKEPLTQYFVSFPQETFKKKILKTIGFETYILC